MIQKARFDIMRGDYFRGQVTCMIDSKKVYTEDEFRRLVLATRPSLLNKEDVKFFQVPIGGKLAKINVEIPVSYVKVLKDRT